MALNSFPPSKTKLKHPNCQIFLGKKWLDAWQVLAGQICCLGGSTHLVLSLRGFKLARKKWKFRSA